MCGGLKRTQYSSLLQYTGSVVYPSQSPTYFSSTSIETTGGIELNPQKYVDLHTYLENTNRRQEELSLP